MIHHYSLTFAGPRATCGATTVHPMSRTAFDCPACRAVLEVRDPSNPVLAAWRALSGAAVDAARAEAERRTEAIEPVPVPSVVIGEDKC